MIKLTQLKQSQATKLLNSTPLGSIMGDRVISRHLQKAGYRISGDSQGKTLNIIKYAAWLTDELGTTKMKKPVRDYDDIKESSRQRNMQMSKSGRDIGNLPNVFNPERKRKCASSLKLFCETYFPDIFYLGWSSDHYRVIEKMETAVTDGGLFALAMPRGSGKTAISVRAAIWAVFYGYCKYLILIAATEDNAWDLLNKIKTEVEENRLLAEDFPEVCFPVAKLEGINNRSGGQTLNGQRTKIGWSGKEIVLPTVQNSLASGVVIECVGLLGNVRGKNRMIDGADVRPDMVLIDDPQNDESANSPEQNKKRLRVLKGAILGLAGPDKSISGVMPCTVIRPGDMVDVILDRRLNPEWKGERTKLLKSFPTNMEMWHKYREISIDSYQMHYDNREGTEFYKEHQAEMDEGAVSSWPERFAAEKEISAIQYAMNLFFERGESFFAEYQNDPVPDDLGEIDKISTESILERLNHRKRGTVPVQATTLTMYIDVHKDLLYFTVCAFSENFTCWVIDYGAFPEQKRRHFTLKEASPTCGDLYPDSGIEGIVYQSLRDLTNDYLAREWVRDDGIIMRIDKCAIDSGWGISTDSVYRICRESQYASLLLPSKGDGLSAAKKPYTEYRREAGVKLGLNWRLLSAKGKRTVRLLEIDTNFWKSFFRERLRTSMGDGGSFSLFGGNVEQHRMLAEHLSAETSIPTAGQWRKVDVWKLTVGRDNHLLDCVVGCMVLASIQGCVVLQRTIKPTTKKAQPQKGRVHKVGKVHEIRS